MKQFSEYEIDLLQIKQRELINSKTNLLALLSYYDQHGKMLYDEIIRTASLSFENGEIDFFTFANSTETALQIKLEHIDNILNYNKIILELNYLSKE